MPMVPAEVVAIGHSLGGGCALAAQVLDEAKLFSRMFIFEPNYLFNDIDTRSLLGLPAVDSMKSPMVVNSLKRRCEWASLQEAAESLSKKHLYAAWDSRAFDGFLKDGIIGYEAVPSQFSRLSLSITVSCFRLPNGLYNYTPHFAKCLLKP